ncbi:MULTISPECIES: universal stress protein [unclassified Nocardioides]|uniref:universal stress protein n=1 Tax=unclassified Nocardioides TaxID=2615069 RepID=UPI003610E98E
MTGRIVVGIDGSEQSRNALEWAVARARLGGEELALVSAYTLTPVFDFYGYHGLADTQPIDWYAEYSQKLVDTAAARVRDLAPDLACTATVERGHPGTVLAAASESASALVVGRRGLGGAASAVLGSVSNRLTVEAKCPVVVVGADELPTTGPVVVGLDGSDFAVHALRYAIAEAAARRTSVRAIAAFDYVHPAFSLDDELAARMKAGAEDEAASVVPRALAQLGADAASVDIEHVAVAGPAAEAILDNSDDAQLIVVGSHGKGLVRRVLLGSVSRQVLNDAERPVAVVDLPEH